MWPILPFEERPEFRQCLRREDQRVRQSVAGLNLAEVESPRTIKTSSALHLHFA